jgi:hypothetical protein
MQAAVAGRTALVAAFHRAGPSYVATATRLNPLLGGREFHLQRLAREGGAERRPLRFCRRAGHSDTREKTTRMASRALLTQGADELPCQSVLRKLHS